MVIVGAGFGGLTAAKRLEREDVDVTLVDRHNYHSFQPLLYQVATAGSERGRRRLRGAGPVPAPAARAVPQGAGDRCRLGRPSAACCATNRRCAFDHLILAAGSSTNYFGVPGAAEFAFPLYGLEDAVRVRNHLLSLFEAADAVPGSGRRRGA